MPHTPFQIVYFMDGCDKTQTLTVYADNVEDAKFNFYIGSCDCLIVDAFVDIARIERDIAELTAARDLAILTRNHSL